MFDFKLKALLHYRRQREDVFKQEYARSRQQWTQARDALEGMYTRWKAFLDEWSSRQANDVAINEIALYHTYMIRLKADIARQTQQVRECMEQMENRREELIKACKEKKMLERLEEKHRAQYRELQTRREVRALDETATQRFAVKGMIK